MRTPDCAPGLPAVAPIGLPRHVGAAQRPVLSVQAVGLRFGAVAALQDVNLRIDAGERVALVGSNGSGKSSLLRLLGGLLQPQSGAVRRDAALRQAMVFQHPFMLRASVQTNVALGLWLAGVRWRDARGQAAAALARVGMAALALRNARALSVGQKQRVALARAWALQPQLWLLDEPTASLDPHAKREVEALMAELAAPSVLHPGGADPLAAGSQRGEQPEGEGEGEGGGGIGSGGGAVTMVFASHNLGQVKRLANRVIYLEQGRILADLPTAEFFDAQRLQSVSRAAHLFVKGELA